MQLMNEMQKIDDLMGQIQDAERGGDLDRIDADLLKELMGDESAEDLDSLKKLLDALEEAGYIRPTDGNKFELTPRGTRMIGQKALGEIYARLKRQSLGNHALPEEGRFGERLEQTKPYEYGDPFHLHMPRTLRNAIDRNGPATPVRLRPDDFEIYRSELITSTATAMLVDLSWSMALRGSFQAAKKVALALHNLITSQYPKDSFYIIGFAAYAKELKAHDLPYLQWDEYVLGPNMQHALLLADKLLAKHHSGTKQIIMISDGEPTAHLENGQAQFAYPPTAETIRRDVQGGQALHHPWYRDQYVHAGIEPLPARVHGSDRQDQRRSRVLHLSRAAWRVHSGRLRATQTHAARATGLGDTWAESTSRNWRSGCASSISPGAPSPRPTTCCSRP